MAQHFGRIGAGVRQGPRVFTKFNTPLPNRLDQLRNTLETFRKAWGITNPMTREARRQWEAEYERTYGRKPYEEEEGS